MKEYLYFLPKKDFFKKGYRGSVIHALGIVQGFKDSNIPFEVLHFGGFEEFSNNQNEMFESRINSFFYCLNLLKDNSNRLLIRYSFSNIFYIWMLLILSRNRENICLEVNTSASMHRSSKLKFRLVSILEKGLFNRTGLIYVVSSRAKEFLLNLNPKWKLKIVVIPNALIKSSSVNLEEGVTKRLVYFGSTHGYYDFEKLVNWLGKFNSTSKSKIELHVYGNDDNGVIEGIISIGNTDVKYWGRYNNADIYKILNDRDILILPYKSGTIADFGSPTKLFEYMSMKLPILATNVGQINDLIKDNFNGLIYFDYDSFEAKLRSLISNDNLCISLGENASNDVCENHTWKKRITELTSRF